MDLLAAIANWDFFEHFGPATIGYTPSTRDIEFGARIRQAWYAFARWGNMDHDNDNWKTMLGHNGDNCSTSWINVVGETVSSHCDYKGDACKMWYGHGLDERFWLCN